MTLQITIHPNEKLEFFAQYDPLTPLQKKIFQALQWWLKKFPSAFPKQERIAKFVKCSRKHVNRVIKMFEKFGWLSQTSRGNNRTKILGMPTHLVLMDLPKREYLRRLEVTAEVTHSISKYRSTNSTFGAGSLSHLLSIPEYLSRLKISLKNKLKLSMVPENIYHTAYETTRAKHAKIPFQGPNDVESYVVGTAIKMAQQKGIKLAWGLFYQTARVMGIAA